MSGPHPGPIHEFPCEARQRTGRVLVAGCGYVGTVLARDLAAQGWEVVGITRSPETASALQGEPFGALACDLGDRAALARLGAFDAVIHCASSSHGGPESYRQVYLEGMRNLCATLRPARFLFTGSTSVYAQRDGSLVTETSPTEPSRETGRLLLEAERAALEAGGTVARLAGIYGPGRWAPLRKFLAGEAVIEGEGLRWINQIHRADAASALAFLLSAPPGIYNVSDGTPVTQRELYAAFAAHFHRPLPPTGTPSLESKRGWTHKQVVNAKLTALGWRPLYPSFRDALALMPLG